MLIYTGFYVPVTNTTLLMETPPRALMTGPGRGAASTHCAWPRVRSSVEDRNPVKVLLVEPPVTRYTCRVHVQEEIRIIVLEICRAVNGTFTVPGEAPAKASFAY